MKRSIKRFIFVLFSFFMLSTSVLAKELTINELGDEATKIEKDAGYVYILGEHAFTSKYNITQEAIIAAGDSLNLENPTDLTQIVIYHIERTRDEDFNPTGWKAAKNALGSKQIPEKFNVKWVDMHRILETSEAKLSANVEDTKYATYKDVLNKSLNFQASNFYGKDNAVTIDGTKVKGLLLKKSYTDLFFNDADKAKYAKAEYYFATIIEVPNANAKTTITVKNLKNVEKVSTWSDFDVTGANETPGIVILFPIDKADWEKNKEIVITVDVDGDNDEPDDVYGKTEYKLDLSDLKFQEESKVDLSTEELPTADVEYISKTWGYTKSISDTYELTPVGGNKYELTGNIVEQKIKENVFSGEEETDLYFLFNIGSNIDKSLYGKATVTFPGNGGTKTNTITDNTGVTILFSVKDKDNKPIKITVDLDGNGDEYYPVEYEIDLSKVTFEKSSKFTVQSIADAGLQENPLKDAFGWTQPANYDVHLTTEGTTVKVTGLLPILESFESNKHPFGTDDETGYYLPFVIKTDAGKKGENPNVTVQFIHEGEEPKTLTAANFDGDDVIYILRHLHKDAQDKTFKIIVDMDGEDNPQYAPYEITFDWSDLKLQERTNASLKLNNASDGDKEQLTEWDYNSSVNSLKDINEEKSIILLDGIMKEQVVAPEAFGEKNINGYYFDFTFEIPDGIDREKVTISRLTSAELNNDVKKEFTSDEWIDDGKLTILFRFPTAPTCAPEGNDCKLYYKVDFDGSGNEYLPTLYTIDYSKVTFQKSSLVKLEPVTSLVEDEWKGFTQGEDYKVKFEEESSTFKVKGLITIFDDSWKESNPFGKDANDYYLAFKLSKEEVAGSDSETIVKFLTDGSGHGDTHSISDSDFKNNNSIFVLKYLNPNVEQNNKKFTITVDFDEGEEYEPYTITIDWSELDFQYESGMPKTEVAKEDDEVDTKGYISETDKTQLTEWGYSFENAGSNLEIKNEKSNYKLAGSVKEQHVNAGFKSEDGYYIPIKIYGPTAEQLEGTHFATLTDYLKKWTVTVHDEDSKEIILTPTDADYENGFITVLFKLNKEKQKIKYKIDWDGDGDIYLPHEVTIKYDGLTYQTENKITFEYFNETTGKVETIKKIVYQNETINSEEIPALDKKGYIYHKFDYWYNTNESSTAGVDLNTLKTGENQDITLKAHYTLDMDKFLIDVVEDLKNAKTDFSEDFTELFDVKKENNTITFTVLDSDVKLSDMNRTSIPGTIAYILQRGEVKDITLMFKGKQVIFKKDEVTGVQSISLDPAGSALKEKVQAGAQALFKEVLSDAEETMTLNKMAVAGNTFTLKIGALDDTVKLNDGAQTEYTFKFETDVAVVTSEEDLDEALKNNSIKHINITNDFNITKEHEINLSNLTIKSSSEKKDTLTVQSEQDIESIFKVSGNNVTISNITLKNAPKRAILVTNGSLTTDKVDITNENELAETFEAAIEVKTGASLTATNMTFDKETYEKPLVKADKTGTTVKLTDSSSKDAQKVTDKQKITKYVSESKTGGDTLSSVADYNYINYYNEANNSKIIKTIFYNYEAGNRATFVRYNHYNEKIDAPEGTPFTGFNYDGEKYELLGFTVDRAKILFSAPQEGTPEGVIAPQDLKATEDKHYWTSFKLSLVNESTRKVTTEGDFKQALQDKSVSAIYIDGNIVIDLKDEDFTIDRNLAIIGKGSSKPTIKAKKVTISSSADDVTFNRVKLEINAQVDQEALIVVEGKKLTVWQSGITNTGTAVDYAIKYKNSTESVVDVRWMGIDSPGFSESNINKAYIYAEKLGAGSKIYLNSFKALSTDGGTAVVIKDFAADAQSRPEEEGESDVVFAINTINTKYAIEIMKDASGNKSDIDFENGSSEITFGLHYTKNSPSVDYSQIKLHNINTSKIKNTFIDESGSTTTDVPSGAKAPSPVVAVGS